MRRPQAVAFSLLLSLSLLLYTPAAAFLCPTSPRLPTKTSRLVCTACNKQSPSQEPSSYVRAPQPGVKTKSSSGFLEATALLTVAGLVAAPATVWALDCVPTALLLADADPWVTPLKTFLDPFLGVSSLAFLIRIVLSWYPQVNLNKMPMNIIAWPTEPFLKAVRTFVPPAFGVDISPIIWLAFLSFLREILVSEQGLLTILENK